MTSRWLISSKLGAAFATVLLLATPGLAGTFTGKVQLVESKNPDVRKHGDYSGVVAWLELRDPAAALPSPKPARMLQKDKHFLPHVLPIQVGAAVEFPNLDPIFHNAFSVFSGQPFDLGLYPPNKSKTVRFTHEGVVQVFCNIHPTMSAVILVLHTPFFAVTNVHGEFEIAGVPPGRYRLRFYHERALPATLQALDRDVVVDGNVATVAPVAISETGYLPIPHMNKFGKEYHGEGKESGYPR